MKIKLLTDYPRHPKEGHHFPDSSGVLLKGKDIPDLLKTIKEFRIRNSFPPGKPEQEVATYYHGIFPEGTLVTEEPELPQEEESKATLMGEWIARLWFTTQNKLASEEVIKVRASVCIKCRFHLPWKANPKDVMEMDINRKVIILSQGLAPSEIGYCQFHHLHAGLACALLDPQAPEHYSACWMKSLP